MDSGAVRLEQVADAGAEKSWVGSMGGWKEGADFEEVLEDIQGHSEMPVRRLGVKDADERRKEEKGYQNRCWMRSHQSKLPSLMFFPVPVSSLARNGVDDMFSCI